MSQITKRALEHSLKNLLLKKPLNKITINDIAEECGINRMTLQRCVQRCKLNRPLNASSPPASMSQRVLAKA